MGDASVDPPVSPYAKNTTAGPHPGERATCELCEHTRRCFDEYGLIACQRCRKDLLPAGGIL